MSQLGFSRKVWIFARYEFKFETRGGVGVVKIISGAELRKVETVGKGLRARRKARHNLELKEEWELIQISYEDN
jgi:hypothetical protein